MEPIRRPADMSATLDGPSAASPGDVSPAGWPNIADYWPDAPHHMGPAAPAGPPPKAGVTLRPRKVTRPLIGVAFAVLVLLAGGGVAVSRLTTRPTAADSVRVPATPATTAPAPAEGSPEPAVVQPDPSSPGPTPTNPAAPTNPATPSRRATRAPAPPVLPTGTLLLAAGFSDITVRADRTDGGIATVSTPRGGTAAPRISRAGSTFKVVVAASGTGGLSAVDVRLDNRVAWSIRLDGGARRFTVDMTGATVRRFDLRGGVERAELTLPKLAGTLPIETTGGVKVWRIRTDGQLAVRVRAEHGIGRTVLYGRVSRGVPGDTSVTSDVAGARGGIELSAAAGVGLLAVSE